MTNFKITLTCLVCNNALSKIQIKNKGLYCSRRCHTKHRLSFSIKERIYPLINKTEYCWIWQGSQTSDGYGKIQIKKKTYRVHRLVYEIETGEQIGDKLIRHFVCDNPICCNPAHLKIGTPADNSKDMVNHKRQQCGERRHNAKLTSKQVANIRQDTRDNKIIAKEYGVSRRNITYIKANTWWKDI